MQAWAIIGIGAAVLVAGGAVIGFGAHRRAAAHAEEAYAHIVARPDVARRRFDPEQVAHLPEIAQRYFRHAIAPGTPLYVGAELEMRGAFLLGDKEKFQTYDMVARQALRPPEQFVWIPRLRSGTMVITGSDALVSGRAWTRFWLLGLIPVANVPTSADLVRSAHFRAAVESAVWLPPSLLPENGVEWRQMAPDQARVVLRKYSPELVLNLTLDSDGAVREVVGQRWSNANPEMRFQLQPFGGTMTAEATFQGLTVPSEMAVGNHYGTDDYLPFFQARITHARYF